MKNLKFWALALLTSALIFAVFYMGIAQIDEKLQERYPETPETAETEPQTVKETETEIIFTPIETEEIIYDTETEKQEISAQQSDETVSESYEEIQSGTAEVSEFYTQTYDSDLNESSSRQVNYDDLILLAKIVENEAGSYWLSDHHQQMVASVVINRMADPAFPDTLWGVISAGWYDEGPIAYNVGGPEAFAQIIPSERAIQNAEYVLANGPICSPSIIWQAEFPQGQRIVEEIYDPINGTTTYFCEGYYE